MSKEGFRIWEIDNKTMIPKEIASGSMDKLPEAMKKLDTVNKTYAIRLGVGGLK